jgi:hypothetical protein
VLVRLRRHAEAAAACRELLADVRRAGMTAQVWTTLRLVAELLADLGEPAAAAAILLAADADPLAPVVFGPDRERHDRIRAAATGPATGPAPAGLGDTMAFALAALSRHH